MIHEKFASLAASGPDRVALIEGWSGTVWSRRMLLERAQELASSLSSSGLAARDLVALQLPNSADFAATILAASLLDLVIVPLDRDAPRTEVDGLLEHFSIRALVHRTATGTSISTNDASTPRLPAAVRLIKLSSGSTGRPKGIMATAEQLAADCANICSTMLITDGDINLGAIPFSHSYGFSNLILPLLLEGTAVVASNDYLPQSVLTICNEQRCTVAPLIPMVFEHLTTAATGGFETVRTFLSAGAPLSSDVGRRFRERFGIPIHSFYGCSECGGITYDRPGDAAGRGTVGAAMEGVTLVIDATTNRMTVRSEAVSTGYFHGAGDIELFGQSSYLADDLAATNADAEVILTGRVGDLINTAGKKINPREVEHVLMQMPGVREVKAYGAAAGARGEVVAVAVVASDEITRDGIRAFCRERLSAHKVPRIVKLVERIPLDERGKFRKAGLESL